MPEATYELRKERKSVDPKVLEGVKKTKAGRITTEGIKGFGFFAEVGISAERALAISRASLASEREEILGEVREGRDITRSGLMAFLDSETKIRESFIKVELGNFELGSGEKKRKQRADQIVNIIGADHLETILVKQECWQEDDGLFGEAAWGAAEKLRRGVALDELSDEEYNAWAYLKMWGEVLEEKGGRDPRVTLIEFQSVLESYGVEVQSLLSKNGVIKLENGVAIEEKIFELHRLKLRSKGYFDVVSEHDDKVIEINLPDEMKIKKIERVNLGNLVRVLGEEQVGSVVDAYLSNEMNPFLNPNFASSDQLPVKWTMADKGDNEGLVFTNISNTKTIDLMRLGLDAAGYLKKWEDIARLAMAAEAMKFGYHENRLDKAYLENLPKLASASMMLTLAETLPGFAEAVMDGSLSGQRHAETGEPTGSVFEKDRNGNWVSRAPKAGEGVTPLEMSAEIRKNLTRVLKEKFEGEGRKDFKPWVVEMAYTFLWNIGEGIEVPWTVNKMRSAEEIVYYSFGANIEIFYEWPDAVIEKNGILVPNGKMSETMAKLDKENGWDAGTAHEQAIKLMRWLLPAMVPFGTHLTEVLKFMSNSPKAQDVAYSMLRQRMPAYDDFAKIDRNLLPAGVTIDNIHEVNPEKLNKEIKQSAEYKRLILMRVLKFKGPYEDIEEIFKEDVLLRERIRWQAYFGVKFGTKKKIRGAGTYNRQQRHWFNYKDTNHVQVLVGEIINKPAAKEKLRLLGFSGEITVEAVRYLFNNEKKVQSLANEIQKRWGWNLDIKKIFKDKGLDELAKALVKVEAKGVKDNLPDDLAEELKDLSDEEMGKVINAVKLELTLRDLDSWGMKANLIMERGDKGSWRQRLLEMAENMRGSLDAWHYKLAYNYTLYRTLAILIFDWPEMLSIDGIAKGLEKLRDAYHEFGRSKGLVSHPIEIVTTMLMYHQAAAIINEILIGSGKQWIMRPQDRLDFLKKMVDEYYPKKGKVNMKYLHF